MARGWIKVDRKLFDSWLWKDKPFSKGQAWIDLIMLANHEYRKFPFGSEIVEVDRGSFITSELKLMERWGWGKSKVRTFLKLLENDSMIERKTNHKRTEITIVKYSDYQDIKTNNRPLPNRKRTTAEPLPYTNNNYKECITTIKKKDMPSADEKSIDYSSMERKWN